jgi:hypothetical protein
VHETARDRLRLSEIEYRMSRYRVGIVCDSAGCCGSDLGWCWAAVVGAFEVRSR